MPSSVTCSSRVSGSRRSGSSSRAAADVVIDATGKLVLPGAVDPHTHLDMPFGGTVTADDVTSGHTAAAFGGTTCHVDFVIQTPGGSFADALAAWHEKRDGKAIIDNGFHMAVTDLKDGGSLEELATLPGQGVTSYKLFMAYKGALMVDDETLFRTMQVARETGALVMVHAENGDAIDVLVKEALAAGNTAPVWHALTRPPELEGEATNRAIQLARIAGAPLYVVHVSCKESVDPIAKARRAGWKVWGETCTQYFFIDQTFLERPDFEGAKFVYTPPPRAKANQDVLWDAVRTDVLSAISTDHCAFLWDGQKTMGRDDFSKIPNGGPGPREPPAHDPRVRRALGADHAEPHGRVARHQPGEALRPLPAEGHDRPRIRRRHRDLRSESSQDDHRGRPAFEVGLQPLRGHRGHRRHRHRPHPRHVVVDGGELQVEPGFGQFVKRARFGEELV